MDITIKGKDNNPIHIKIWNIESPKGVVQILHGMREYIERYDEFAKFLNEQGYAVIGHDHRGHGTSSLGGEGYFALENGWKLAMSDIELVNKYATEKYNNKDIIILGHSMGSFMLREALIKSELNVKAAIISGTGSPKRLILGAGASLAKIFMLVKGKLYKSEFFEKITFWGFFEKFKDQESKHWLTSDDLKLSEFSKHKQYGMLMPLVFYYDLYKGLLEITKPEFYKVNIPLFILSGEDDPVGEDGKIIKEIIKKYSKYTKVDSKIYPKGRHEMLNEVNREEVYQNLFKWIDEL